ncbi:hypothetical protein HDV05_003685 [Chytridiales sp. JEL 0842]|nr:hypothetical protein HDV05_003685 [Chytridiales sp. JEL 0842]
MLPGNTRAAEGNPRNPPYTSTYTFPNDFPAVLSDAAPTSTLASASTPSSELFQTKTTRGLCKVICFSPKHNLTMAEMSLSEIESVIGEWVRVHDEIENQSGFVGYVQIFENKGSVMGCSNPHPHGQVWATEDVPEEPSKELHSLAAYKSTHPDSCLLCDYTKAEIQPPHSSTRIVVQNNSFLCLVPFWALWPFETMIVSKQHVSSLKELDANQRKDLADILSKITIKYDNLFQCAFPYSMGIHGAPTKNWAGFQATSPASGKEKVEKDTAHLHIHFYPPLLRSASVKKFLVGFEMLGEAQRDLTAEQAAERLRGCGDVHYKKVAAEQEPKKVKIDN